MQKDDALLYDVLESARLAVSYVQDSSIDDFLANTQLQDAVIRRIEIIGEAARHISEQTRALLPNLPWVDMAGMRNFLIHQYGEVDAHVVWDTVKIDLPPLIAELESIADRE